MTRLTTGVTRLTTAERRERLECHSPSPEIGRLPCEGCGERRETQLYGDPDVAVIRACAECSKQLVELEE